MVTQQQHIIPCGWCCPCCNFVVSPALSVCPMCNPNAQLNDETRALHDCPIWGPKVDAVFRSMSASVTHGENPIAAAKYQVPQRPHINYQP